MASFFTRFKRECMLNVCTMAQLVYFEQGAVYTLQPRDVMLYADQGARDVF